jgi:hypothetical protein
LTSVAYFGPAFQAPAPPQPATKKPTAGTTTAKDLDADIDTIVRRHFFPNMPEEAAEKIEKKAI